MGRGRVLVQQREVLLLDPDVERDGLPVAGGRAEKLETTTLQLSEDAQRRARGGVASTLLRLHVALPLADAIAPQHVMLPVEIDPDEDLLAHELALGEKADGEQVAVVAALEGLARVRHAQALRTELDHAVGVRLEGFVHAHLLPRGVLALLLQALDATGASGRLEERALFFPPHLGTALLRTPLGLDGLELIRHLVQVELHHELLVALNVSLALPLVLGHAVRAHLLVVGGLLLFRVISLLLILLLILRGLGRGSLRGFDLRGDVRGGGAILLIDGGGDAVGTVDERRFGLRPGLVLHVGVRQSVGQR